MQSSRKIRNILTVVVEVLVVAAAVVEVVLVVAAAEHPDVFDTSSQTGSLQLPQVSPADPQPAVVHLATQKKAPPLQAYAPLL